MDPLVIFGCQPFGVEKGGANKHTHLPYFPKDYIKLRTFLAVGDHASGASLGFATASEHKNRYKQSALNQSLCRTLSKLLESWFDTLERLG